MKLLIITQKVNKDDGYFGFFHDWLKLFAAQCDEVTVIGLEVGSYDLPSNVRVLSLGKEDGRSLLKYVTRFYRYAWKYRNAYTHVFCHMCTEYAILGAPIWKLLRKKIGLWYIHRNVNMKLRLAEKLIDVAYTSTPESFRIESKKRNFMGQAVDLAKYARPAHVEREDDTFTIVSVGRLTPIKNLDTLIRATAILRERGHKLKVKLIGAAVMEKDVAYEKMLHELVIELKLEEQIIFVGNVPNKEIAEYYWKSDLSLNLCPTGGMDKAILESMAGGIPAIVSNEAFRDYFGEHANELIFQLRDPKDCADKIEEYIKREDKRSLNAFLFAQVSERSSLERLITNILAILGKA